MKMNQAAFEIGRLAERMAAGYYAHAAAIVVATDPRAKALVSVVQPGQAVPIGEVTRKDGTRHIFNFHHYLDQASTNPTMVGDFERVWLVGSLLAVGDALAKQRYFDHAPELELVYHLRNGIAHGNVFHINHRALDRLRKSPALNRLAYVRSGTRAEFEIVATLEGQPVLFDFIGPADVLDLLMSVGIYLTRIGNGDPPRD